MHLLDLLKSGAFQGAVGLISVLIAVLSLARTKSKRLSYQVVRNADLFEQGQSVENHYTLTINEQPVGNLALVVLTLRNTGSLAIRKADFDDPLQFRFAGDTTVLSARILTTAPDTLTPHLTHTPIAVELAPLLLKSRESLSLEVLLSKRPDRITPIARMAEVKLREVGHDVDATSRLYYWTAAGTWGLALFVWGLFIAGHSIAMATHQPYSLRRTLPFVLLMSTMPLLTAFSLHRRS